VNKTIQSASTGHVRLLASLVLVGGIAAVAVTGDAYWVVVAAPVGAGALWLSSGDSGLSSADSDSEDDAMETLKQQYATGEIDELEFERRLETLIETESADAGFDSGGSSDTTQPASTAQAGETTASGGQTETADEREQGSSADPRSQSRRRSPDRSRCGPHSKKSHGRCR